MPWKYRLLHSDFHILRETKKREREGEGEGEGKRTKNHLGVLHFGDPSLQVSESRETEDS